MPKERNFVRDVQFSINGSAVEVVQSWPHLGHIISSDMDDASDIDRCRHKLIGQINNVLCSFHQVDSIVKIGLLKSYCLSLYGCELWLLQHPAIENICKSWRNGMRRVWGVPFNCRSAIVQILSDTLPLFDIICKRAVMFVRNCLGSQSDVVRYTANHGVYFSRMSSVLGRNVLFSCEHFAMSVDDLMGEKFNKHRVHDICLHRRTAKDYCRAICIFELLMLRRGLLLVPGMDFSAGDVDIVMRDICNDWC